MLTFTKVSFPVIVAWCMVTFPQAALVEEKTVVSTKPVLVLSGADSRVDKLAYHRVIWSKHGTIFGCPTWGRRKQTSSESIFRS